MQVFITGATGVIGRALIPRLRREGHTIRALARSPRNRETLGDLGAEAVDADMFDVAQMTAAIAGCDTLLHLATRIPPAAEMRKKGAWDVNDRLRREGTRVLVAAARATPGVKTVLYPSIHLFYGDGGDGWLDASRARVEAANPLRSTLDAEQQVLGFGEAVTGRRALVLRLGNIYGPTSRDSRQTLDLARKGLAMPLGPLSAYKTMIWIDDVATAIVAALESAPTGIYDVVEDTPFTQAESIAALAAAVGRRSLRRLPRLLLRFALPADMRGVVGRSQRVSNRAFKSATGWAPAVPDQRRGWAAIAAAV